VIPALLQKLHWAKEDQTREVDVWGSGKALREFLYVDDLVEACEYLDTSPEVLGPINVGSRQEVSIRELVEEVKDVVGYSGNVRFDNSKPDGMPIKRVDTSRMDQLGWQSKTSLRDGLERTYAWFLQSQQQLRK
jgi:GDP-L-fucose synthase